MPLSNRQSFCSLQCWRCSALCTTLRITPVVTSGCKPPIIRWIASFARMQSIRQSVQDGQFLCRLAQKASDLSVASHTDKGIERFLVYVVATALAIDQTPTLQLIEPANDRGAGQAHIWQPSLKHCAHGAMSCRKPTNVRKTIKTTSGFVVAASPHDNLEFHA